MGKLLEAVKAYACLLARVAREYAELLRKHGVGLRALDNIHLLAMLAKKEGDEELGKAFKILVELSTIDEIRVEVSGATPESLEEIAERLRRYCNA